jgi:DNA repair ATPase RecN
MPLPILLGAAAFLADLAGADAVKKSIDNAIAKEKLQEAKKRYAADVMRIKRIGESVCKSMVNLDAKEEEVLGLLDKFKEMMARVENRPQILTNGWDGSEFMKFNRSYIDNVASEVVVSEDSLDTVINEGEDAVEAWNEMKKRESQMNSLSNRYYVLKRSADAILNMLQTMGKGFETELEKLNDVLNHYSRFNAIDWRDMTPDHQAAVDNVVMLAGTLHRLCHIDIVDKTDSPNLVNMKVVKEAQAEANEALKYFN